MDRRECVHPPNLTLLAPKLDELSWEILFGDIWKHGTLSKWDRNLITVAALVAMYRPEQLPFHLDRAVENGLSGDELTIAFTHLTFYADWPAAVSALNVYRQRNLWNIETVAPDEKT